MNMNYEDLVRYTLALNGNGAVPFTPAEASENGYSKLAFSTDHRLAVYGTLAPGRVNHYLLKGMEGEWSIGKIRGVLSEQGWGMTYGYPAMIWRPHGADTIEVHLLHSVQLVAHWDRLDDFEGDAYRRIVVPVALDNDNFVLAQVYALNEPLPAK